eukprot:gene38014-46187_t
MTTNHIERLDPALIRPGRVDMVQEIGDATDYQIKKLFVKFYPDSEAAQAEAFVKGVREVTARISMASLQGYLLRHKNSASAALGALSTLLDDVRSPVLSPSSPSTGPVVSRVGKVRPVRPLTAEEVDKMVFNPQPGDAQKAQHNVLS